MSYLGTRTTKAEVTIGKNYKVVVYRFDSGHFSADVHFIPDAVWVGTHTRDSYEEALIEAGSTIAHHTAQRLAAGRA